MYWSKFEGTHDQLSPFETTAPEHPYFVNREYENVGKVYEKLILVLKDARSKLEAMTSDSDSMVTSWKGKSENTPELKSSEGQAKLELAREYGENQEWFFRGGSESRKR
ncbi:unnamed protein product [Hermetia illucens]|uniref:Uncharacterized protein n=1 Tax=Hermetia illucens TaxID=343691 RepID=A0A7R8YSF0_HERIL|nr:unnamed protein product [Hermetia illucens]